MPSGLKRYWDEQKALKKNQSKTKKKKTTKRRKKVSPPGKGIKGQIQPNLAKVKANKAKAKAKRIAAGKPKHSDEKVWTIAQGQEYCVKLLKKYENDPDNKYTELSVLNSLNKLTVSKRKLDLDEKKLLHSIQLDQPKKHQAELDMSAFLKHAKQATNKSNKPTP